MTIDADHRIDSYHVIEKTSPSELQRAVEDYLLKGWSPQGGICINARSGEYLQAVTSCRKSRMTAQALLD